MKASTKKWILAGATAFVTSLGDTISQAMSAVDPVDFKRVLILGLITGVVVRAGGAILAIIATTPTEPTDAKVQPKE